MLKFTFWSIVWFSHSLSWWGRNLIIAIVVVAVALLVVWRVWDNFCRCCLMHYLNENPLGATQNRFLPKNMRPPTNFTHSLTCCSRNTLCVAAYHEGMNTEKKKKRRGKNYTTWFKSSEPQNFITYIRDVRFFRLYATVYTRGTSISFIYVRIIFFLFYGARHCIYGDEKYLCEKTTRKKDFSTHVV